MSKKNDARDAKRYRWLRRQIIDSNISGMLGIEFYREVERPTKYGPEPPWSAGRWVLKDAAAVDQGFDRAMERS